MSKEDVEDLVKRPVDAHHHVHRRFEYKTASMNFPAIAELNMHGEEGWQLCGIFHDVYVFKRELL